MAGVVADAEFPENQLGHPCQGHGFGRLAGCPECFPERFHLIGAEHASATEATLALQGLCSTGDPLLAPSAGRLTMNPEESGHLRRRDAFRKQSHGLEAALLEGGLIDWSLQSHVPLGVTDLAWSFNSLKDTTSGAFSPCASLRLRRATPFLPV